MIVKSVRPGIISEDSVAGARRKCERHELNCDRGQRVHDQCGAKCSPANKDTAKQQRGDEFRIMRSDVFQTDQAVAIALKRLKTKKISAAQMAAFEGRAATASTPEQIAYLEKEATK